MGKSHMKINWEHVLVAHNQEPPPDLEISSEDAIREEVEDLSDQSLNEKIQRIQSMSKSILAALKDGGTKMRANLDHLKRERERRRLLQQRISKGPCELRKPMKNQCSSLSDALHDVPLATQAQSVFAAKLSSQLKDVSGNNASNAFDSELQCFGHGKQKNCILDGQSKNKERQKGSFSVRDYPFRCISSMTIGEDEVGSSSGSCVGIASSRQSSSPPEGNSFALTSEKASTAEKSRASRKRKGLADTVVVLDEEDAHPVEPIFQAEEEWVSDIKIYYPSRSHPEAVELCGSDLDCLKPGSNLTSPIINFYIQYLQRPISASGNTRGNTHFFNTYFYKKLEEAVSCKGRDKDAYYVKFRRWWKGIDLFQKSYIFLPIHADNHWSLAIICIPAKEGEMGPIILHLDSLSYHNSNKVFEDIESFLRQEWTYLKHEGASLDIPIASKIWKNFSRRISREIISVPQQKNDSDCGLFLLYFIERFLEEAPDRLTKNDLHMFGKRRFRPEAASGLRERISHLLREQFELSRLEDTGSKSPSDEADSDGQSCDSHNSQF